MSNLATRVRGRGSANDSRDHPPGIDAERGADPSHQRQTGSNESIESLTLVAHDLEAGTSEFSITFPAVIADFRYRIRSGRALSEFYDVIAARRPAIQRSRWAMSSLRIQNYHPPRVQGIGQSISALAGTKIQVRAHFDRPLESAVLMIDGNPMPATDGQQPRRTIRSDLEVRDGGGHPRALEARADGSQTIPNIAVEHPIRSFADRPPTVRAFGDGQELRVRPDERLHLRFEVTDDFGISSVRLRIRDRLGDLPRRSPPPQQRAPIGASPPRCQRSRRIRGQHVTIFLMVEDTRPDRQVVKTEPITIRVDAGASSLAEQLRGRPTWPRWSAEGAI